MKSKETEEKIINSGIRKATLDDAFSVAKINYDAWTKNYRGIIDDEFLDTIDFNKKEENMINMIKNQDRDSIFLVSIKDKKIVGFVRGGKKRDKDLNYQAEIYAIYVDPKAQGQGVGKNLMSAIGENSYFKDKKSFYLRTLRDNLETRGFYEKLGAKVFAEKEHEFGKKKYPIVGYYRKK